MGRNPKKIYFIRWSNHWILSKYQIDPSKALPGDIHFFGENDKVSHVGFSLGGEKILHAQGWVKEESFNKNDSNFNHSLMDKYLSSYSIRRNFRPWIHQILKQLMGAY